MKSSKCVADQLPSGNPETEEISFVEEIREFIEDLSNFFRVVSAIYAKKELTIVQQNRIFDIQVDIASKLASFSQMLLLKSEDEITAMEEEIVDQMDAVSEKMILFDIELDYFEPETIFQPEKYYGFKVAQSNISGIA